MAVTFHSAVIFVRDINVSETFYHEVLDQEKEFDFGTNILFKSGLSLWQIKAGHEIESIAGSSTDKNTFELYFETEDIAGSVRKIQSAGVEMLHGLKTESWGQQTIRFFDPDHHLIEVGESLSTFVIRIFRETGSIDATAGITGVDKDTIQRIVSSPA